jgi:quercetin dioxygenase-like cupin family protein
MAAGSPDERTKMKYYTLPEDTVWTEVAPGNRRAVLSERPEMMLVAFSFEEGAVGALHSHPHTQVSYVAEGSFDVTVDGVTTRLDQGSSFIVAPNLVHGVVALSKGLLIDTFTPRRDDFLKQDV